MNLRELRARLPRVLLVALLATTATWRVGLPVVTLTLHWSGLRAVILPGRKGPLSQE